MKRPATDPTREREEVAKATEAMVSNWIIPEVVPQGICTAIVPGTECLDGARLLARTLHTAVLRSRPRTLVLIATGTATIPRIRAMGSLTTTLGDSPIDERLAARIASFWPGDVDIIPNGEDESSLPTLHRIGPLLAQVLVPGCRIIPVEVPAEKTIHFDPIEVGKELGRQLKFEYGCFLLASCTLFAREHQDSPQQAPIQLREDAKVLKHLLEPELDCLSEQVVETGLQNSTPLILATAHAIERERQCGYLLEHGVVEADGDRFGAAAIVL
jgi:hypothetical protein